LPLVPKELTARLTVTSPQLGVYVYDLHLKSTATGNEKPLQFKVGLGTKVIQTFRFTSFCRTKTEYACKVDHPDFSVDKSIAAPAAPVGGVELTLDVLYEPSKLGDIRATLTVASDQGGEFACSLFGHCVTPQPQGPITIKGGSPVSVPIFNPFSKQAVFSLGVDNPVYSVKPNELTIPSKKSATATVTYKTSSASVTTGKLTVTSDESPAPWIYYLKGSN
jgi:hydrocephalus-inducing protein